MDTILSIGIIFKNDIRCIERCLKALQPLRDAVPCELVMADTGSDDGSRAVAEKYADTLFDFPWINDFAAARNAVIDRCTGEWYLSVDTDEYMDEDVEEISQFLLTENQSCNLCRVTIRNYREYSMDGSYADFYTLRMVRLSIGARYQGAIHEAWTGLERAGSALQFTKTIFHHDGYVNMAQNPEKLKRNMSLLRDKVKSDPKNLLTRLQIIESGFQEPDYLDQLKKSLSMVKRKVAGWKLFGPPIFRHAVSIAHDRKLAEFQKWADQAEEWFPDSYFVRIDVKVHRMLESFEREEYAESVRQGEALLEAYADYRAGRGDLNCQACSTLQMASPYHERTVRLCLASACLEDGKAGRALALLQELEFSRLDRVQTENLTKTLCALHMRSQEDTDSLVLAAWEGITTPEPDEKRAEERRLTFMVFGSAAFTANYQQDEAKKANFCRHACGVFAPLAEKCGLGLAASILGTEDPEEMAALLARVGKWAELPFPALSRSIESGVEFPLPGKPLNVESMDELAGRLAADWGVFFPMVQRAAEEDFAQNWQKLCWARGLSLNALQRHNWKSGREEDGMALARFFADVEKVFLPRCYNPQVLAEENLSVLPPMHRFGWYCVQAFDALDKGDVISYTHLLRKGLAAHEGMKAVVEFLTDHTPQLQAARPDPELLALAEKVRGMLSVYPEDDPAVAAIKQSPVYQRVAHLIEE